METTKLKSSDYLKTKERKIAEQQDEMITLKNEQKKRAVGDDNDLDEMTGSEDSDYRFPAEEKNYFHILVNQKQVSVEDKKVLDNKRVIKVHARQFKDRVQTGAFASYDEVKVLHNPLKGDLDASKVNFKPNNLEAKDEFLKTAPVVPVGNVAAREKALNEREAELTRRQKEQDELFEARKKEMEELFAAQKASITTPSAPVANPNTVVAGQPEADKEIETTKIQPVKGK